MMSEEISSEDPPQNEASILKRIGEQLRVSLYTLEEQVALHSPLDIPLYLKNVIEITASWLEQKEAHLRELQAGEDNRLSQTKQLRQFWEPFVTEGARFFVSHDAPADAPEGRQRSRL